MNPSPQEIKAARVKAGLTQAKASSLLHLSTHTWKNYESGRSSMSLALFEHFHCLTK